MGPAVCSHPLCLVMVVLTAEDDKSAMEIVEMISFVAVQRLSVVGFPHGGPHSEVLVVLLVVAAMNVKAVDIALAAVEANLVVDAFHTVAQVEFVVVYCCVERVGLLHVAVVHLLCSSALLLHVDQSRIVVV